MTKPYTLFMMMILLTGKFGRYFAEYINCSFVEVNYGKRQRVKRT